MSVTSRLREVVLPSAYLEYCVQIWASQFRKDKDL